MRVKNKQRILNSVTSSTESAVIVNNTADSAALQISGTFTAIEVKVQGSIMGASDDYVDVSVMSLTDMSVISKITEKGIYSIMGIDVLPFLKVNVTSVTGTANVDIMFVNSSEA